MVTTLEELIAQQQETKNIHMGWKMVSMYSNVNTSVRTVFCTVCVVGFGV